MTKVKIYEDDRLMDLLFGQKRPMQKAADVTDVAERLAEVPRMPVPKKRLVPKKIIVMVPDQRCADIIAKNWGKLRDLTLIKYTVNNSYRGYTAEDVLIETFEYVIRDDKVKGATEEEIINSFICRFDNLMWVAKMDKVLERRILSSGEIDPVTFMSDKEITK